MLQPQTTLQEQIAPSKPRRVEIPTQHLHQEPPRQPHGQVTGEPSVFGAAESVVRRVLKRCGEKLGCHKVSDGQLEGVVDGLSVDEVTVLAVSVDQQMEVDDEFVHNCMTML